MILAPNGRPARRELAFNAPPQPQATGNSLFATPSSTGTNDFFRPRSYAFGGSLENHLNGRQLWELRSLSRQLFAQVPILYAAIQQKAMYSVGDAWQPQFTGLPENKAWGEEVEKWLKESFFPVADARGGGLDFTTSLHLYSLALDFDGDEAMVFTSARSGSGFPQVMFIPADQICGDLQEIPKGEFKGARLSNGCILDREGMVIGYRVRSSNKEDDFADYSTRFCKLGFEPSFTGQRRGIPKLSPALLTWMSIQDISGYLERIVKLHSAQGITHYTESGTADTAETAISDNEDTGTGADTDLKIQRLEGGEFLYMKAGSGEKLEAFNSTTPHPNTEAFVMRLQREGTRAVDWYYELTDPSGIGGAPVRLIQDGARATVRNRQKTLRNRYRKVIAYAVAKAMKEKLIPRNDSLDWWMFEPQLPGVLTVDEGYSRQADLDDLAHGLTTKSRICAKNGGWYEDTDAQRDREFDAYIVRCKKHSEKHGLPLAWVLDHLEKDNPNPVPFAPNTTPTPAEKPAQKP